MSINFHDENNKYTYATRNAHISWAEMVKHYRNTKQANN